MARKVALARWTWLVLGLLGGVALAVLWPQKTGYAVATDRRDNFVIATGFVDTDHEAVYLLDNRTGLLMALILNRQSGKFTQAYQRPIAQDFNVNPTQARYMMVTGRTTINRIPRAQTCLYVAEIVSGQMIAYTFPWLGEQAAGAVGDFILLDGFRFGKR